MGAKTIRVTYSGLRLEPQDFVPGTLGAEEPIIADVTALVTPTEESIDVEITKVMRESSLDNLVGLLRHDTEYRIKPLMRSLYLNVARVGQEGEAPSEEIA